MSKVDVLIPTCNRLEALAATLTALCLQDYKNFSVTIANQGDRQALNKSAPVQSALRLLKLHGHEVQVVDNLPIRGMAQQRQFLFEKSQAQYCLFLDDDIILEPFVVEVLLRVMRQQSCGFTGNAVIGLSFQDDYRPEEEQIEFWENTVEPELVLPGSSAWERYRLHNAANILHVQQRMNITADKPRTYKVAWVGGCVLYDRKKLAEVGGFSFWDDLPDKHCGEDVLAQLRVMKHHGGCGVLPSGAYHQELPTTVTERKVNAPLCLPI